MEKEKLKSYLIVGTHKHERTSIVRELTPEHYETLKAKIGKHNRSGNSIVAIYELDDE
jgi:hypothetical protein